MLCCPAHSSKMRHSMIYRQSAAHILHGCLHFAQHLSLPNVWLSLLWRLPFRSKNCSTPKCSSLLMHWSVPAKALQHPLHGLPPQKQNHLLAERVKNGSLGRTRSRSPPSWVGAQLWCGPGSTQQRMLAAATVMRCRKPLAKSLVPNEWSDRMPRFNLA